MASQTRGNITVTVIPTTKYVNKMEKAITLTDVMVGHKLRVKGLWDKSNNSVSQVVQVKDFSLPRISTVSPIANKPTIAETITPSVTASQSSAEVTTVPTQ